MTTATATTLGDIAVDRIKSIYVREYNVSDFKFLKGDEIRAFCREHCNEALVWSEVYEAWLAPSGGTYGTLRINLKP